MQIIVILLFISMFATFAVMMTGVFFMAKGGEFNRKYSNKLMQARVTCQAFALACLAILILNK